MINHRGQVAGGQLNAGSIPDQCTAGGSHRTRRRKSPVPQLPFWWDQRASRLLDHA
jgi:hypothetical protein